MSLEESEHLLRDLSYNERYSLLLLQLEIKEAEARNAEAEARNAEAEVEARKMEAEFSGSGADKKAEILLARAQSRRVYR